MDGSEIWIEGERAFHWALYEINWNVNLANYGGCSINCLCYFLRNKVTLCNVVESNVVTINMISEWFETTLSTFLSK